MRRHSTIRHTMSACDASRHVTDDETTSTYASCTPEHSNAHVNDMSHRPSIVRNSLRFTHACCAQYRKLLVAPQHPRTLYVHITLGIAQATHPVLHLPENSGLDTQQVSRSPSFTQIGVSYFIYDGKLALATSYCVYVWLLLLTPVYVSSGQKSVCGHVACKLN